jgi:hypothetical protein
VFRRTVSGAVNNLLVFIPPNRQRCTFSAEPVWEIVWCRVRRKIRNRNADKNAGIRLRASAKEVPITQHRCHLFATLGDGQCFHNRCLPDVVCAEKNSVLWQRGDGLLNSAKVVNLYLCNSHSSMVSRWCKHLASRIVRGCWVRISPSCTVTRPPLRCRSCALRLCAQNSRTVPPGFRTPPPSRLRVPSGRAGDDAAFSMKVRNINASGEGSWQICRQAVRGFQYSLRYKC